MKTLWGVYVKKNTKRSQNRKWSVYVPWSVTWQDNLFLKEMYFYQVVFHYHPINDVYHPVVDLNETDFLITLVLIHVYPYWNHTNRSKSFWLMKLWMWDRCYFFLNSTLEWEYDKWATTPLIYDVLLLMTWTIEFRV